MQTQNRTETSRIQCDWQDKVHVFVKANQIHMKIEKKEPTAEELIQSTNKPNSLPISPLNASKEVLQSISNKQKTGGKK